MATTKTCLQNGSGHYTHLPCALTTLISFSSARPRFGCVGPSGPESTTRRPSSQPGLGLGLGEPDRVVWYARGGRPRIRPWGIQQVFLGTGDRLHRLPMCTSVSHRLHRGVMDLIPNTKMPKHLSTPLFPSREGWSPEPMKGYRRCFDGECERIGLWMSAAKGNSGEAGGPARIG